MNIGPDGHCPALPQPDLAGVINDPKNGVGDALRAMTWATLVPTSQHLVSTVKTGAPQATQADIVNSLTIAYCPIVLADAKIPPAMKIPTLDHFSERVYTDLRDDGKN